LQDVKDYAAAAEAFAQVVALRPRDAKALVNRAISLQQGGNLADAMASYSLAYQTDPSTFAAISQALSAASTGLLVLDLETLRDRLSKS
jgi:lipoprotein NlpI